MIHRATTRWGSRAIPVKRVRHHRPRQARRPRMGPPQQSLVPSEASVCYRTNRPCLAAAVRQHPQCLRRNRAPSRCRTMENQIWPRSRRGCSSTRAWPTATTTMVVWPDITACGVPGHHQWHRVVPTIQIISELCEVHHRALHLRSR